MLGSLGHDCLLIDACGDDEAGVQSRASLVRHGVSEQGLLRRRGAVSAQATILVRQADGARHILVRRGTVEPPRSEEVQAAWFAGVDLLHLNGRHEAAARQALAWTRAAGGKVSFDGGAGRFQPGQSDLVAACDWLILAREFAERFCGETSASHPEDLVRKLLAITQAELVVVTDGAAGSWLGQRLGGHSIHHQPARAVPQVVDTTGCGDVYHGAFLHGLLHGWPPASCAAFATDWAARTTQGLGGRFALRGPP
jgi:sugar/nucleoside kinase (ribokinase family)